MSIISPSLSQNTPRDTSSPSSWERGLRGEALIKVCGMREAQNIRDVAALDIDMMGFNFWPKSKRYVVPWTINFSEIPERIKRVGLFVDEMPQTILTYVHDYSLDYVQLHGSEKPELIANLRNTLANGTAHDIKFIKAFGISTEEDLKQTHAYDGVADLFIFDYKSPGKGGSGKHFDWTVLSNYHGSTPFLLSGGIGPDDAEAVKAFHHPMYVGVDVNSKFESALALKDVDKLRCFVIALRS